MKTAGRVLLVIVVFGATVSLFQLWDSERPVGSENLIGKPLPRFAAPLAQSGLNFDANIYTAQMARIARSTAACDVRVSGAFVSCRDIGPRAVIVFWNPKKQICLRQVDELRKAFPRNGAVSAVAVAFDRPVGEIARIARARRWTLSVPVDRDGAVSAIYSVAGCPTVFFARDGEITAVRLGLLDAAELMRAAAKL